MSFVTQGLGKGPGTGTGTTVIRVVSDITVEVDNEPVAVSILTPQIEVSVLDNQFILEG